MDVSYGSNFFIGPRLNLTWILKNQSMIKR